ncbi:hypothetical protein ACFYVL_09205 [Streptomyces sp. NPDC004111]|uniref:hypothetical protein n=1 Tax=Streptomyces sp. NPDC004111 TaxID=3364690 RepID=UPI003683155B
MPHLTSTEIAGRIEDLYGAPLPGLTAHAQEQPPGMLHALLNMHTALAAAEQSTHFHRDRLAQLVQPGRAIGGPEVSHVLDCARRLAEAVAVRDVQAVTATAVLQSLTRTPAPPPAAPPPVPSATAAAPPAPSR